MKEIISAVIAGLFAFLAGLLVNRQGKSQFFSTTVSKERMAWIREIRQLCTELCSISEAYEPDALPPEQRAAFLRARNAILIRLSPKGWYSADDALLELLANPDFGAVKAKVPQIREILTAILKSEWDKIKIEAGNSPWKVWRVRKIQEHLDAKKFHGSASEQDDS